MPSIAKQNRIIQKTIQVSSRLRIADNIQTLINLNSALTCLSMAASMEDDIQSEKCIRIASRLASLKGDD